MHLQGQSRRLLSELLAFRFSQCLEERERVLHAASDAREEALLNLPLDAVVLHEENLQPVRYDGKEDLIHCCCHSNGSELVHNVKIICEASLLE